MAAPEMAWSERQQKMLQAMGLRLWPAAPDDPAQPVSPDRPPAEARSPPEAETETTTATATATAAAAPAGRARGDGTPVMALRSATSGPPSPLAADKAAATVWAPVPAPEVASLGWDALRQTVADCRACALCQGRTQTVFGAGHPQGQWLIVGEAPGAQEDASGEPFVGPSGQLLDGMLQALGLSRQADGEPSRSVYIANALKCRPPANRTPQVQELQACAPFLRRQIALQQPRTILAMGKTAAQALLGDPAPLGQLRGRVHRLGSSSVIVTYHPSYLLRSPGEKAKAWADLCLAADAAGLAPGQVDDG